MSEKPKGLTLYFYRNAKGWDCTNGGISARFDECTLIGIVNHTRARITGQPLVAQPLPEGSRVFEPTDKRPAVYLVMGKHSPNDRFIVPADQKTWQPDGRWWMCGGNYADSSDSRFDELLPGGFAVRVHDRHEG
ncbi:hypothetical protein [Umezawaea sp. Da 62-37]|uniref:hypothetical protein n=1 Tax=Umezawaea sp. Da 62-37 TaxID=3075927 RepID=UPI0028F6CBBA|nr:hypothetical protein [Umezawaea sp. Da 62-37]WNV90292.1 hypothetical protein RM788_19025 [Umezawaea sp. Da 62-37]